MSDLISRSKVISVLEQLEEHSLNGKMDISNAIYLLNNQPTAYDIDKVVAELEERTDFLKDCTKYGNKNAKQQDKSYSAMMMYEVSDLVDDLIEIVKQGMEDIPSESGVLPKDVYHAGYEKAIDDLIEKCESAKFADDDETVLSDIHQGVNSGLAMAIHFAKELIGGKYEIN